jgi:hypothetical protein
MTKEYAKELVERYKYLPDTEVINIISTAPEIKSLNDLSDYSEPVVETFTFKQLKDIANE